MSINSYCEKCYSTASLKSNKCACCGQLFTRFRRYRVIVKHKGQRVTQIADNLTLAREMEAAIRTDIQRGVFDLKQKEKLTEYPALSEFFKQYLESQTNKKTWADDESRYRIHLEPVLGNKLLDNIKIGDIETLKSKLIKADYSPATIRHIIGLLGRVFNIAEKWEVFPGRNPVKNVSLPKIDNERTEMLTSEQTDSLLSVLDSYPDPIIARTIKMLFLTGCRRGEIFGLKWSDVDFDNRIIRLNNPKGGRTIGLQISVEALAVVQEMPKISIFVFPGRYGGKRNNFLISWNRIKKLAGLPAEFRLHGLRHNFASQCVSSGMSFPVVSKLLTHRDLRTIQRYAHLSPDAMREAVDSTSGILTGRNKRKAEVIRLDSKP
jgi:integrase